MGIPVWVRVTTGEGTLVSLESLLLLSGRVVRWAQFPRVSPDFMPTAYDLRALVVVITLPGSVLFWVP